MRKELETDRVSDFVSVQPKSFQRRQVYQDCAEVFKLLIIHLDVAQVDVLEMLLGDLQHNCRNCHQFNFRKLAIPERCRNHDNGVPDGSAISFLLDCEGMVSLLNVIEKIV